MVDDEEAINKKKKKNSSKYNYTFGDVHPGIVLLIVQIFYLFHLTQIIFKP